MEKKQYKKVVLAYSGGLDTSIIIAWLKENYGCEGEAGETDYGDGGVGRCAVCTELRGAAEGIGDF